VGLRSGKVGTVLLNKEHKSNVLSEAFMEDVRRSLEAMEIDEDMKVVVLKAKNDEVFSMGTDLNYLYCRKKSGEVEKIHEYYEKLYNFQNFLASYHKPLLALGNGVLSKNNI
jgi:enoyl-CoA hydratase